MAVKKIKCPHCGSTKVELGIFGFKCLKCPYILIKKYHNGNSRNNKPSRERENKDKKRRKKDTK